MLKLLLTFVLAVVAVSSESAGSAESAESAESSLRGSGRNLSGESENRQLCLDTCLNGNVGETINRDNLNQICLDVRRKFGRDYVECLFEMDKSFWIGPEAAIGQFCNYVCPYEHHDPFN
mmetsp:Transcript_9630/g.14845  ORF Transcript_9630/g.14845 Transcript_9630/m.14845 type:complete len:120 (+) Transcript_9630:89-448(+)|eukprot:CAMPEP_0178921150 /NCGR_PEP_ID=MMETSP0786-20121207/15400_1 /TAXON_ID=186022 /ORGANISM="Thalassionema frauenfeldii, Strain CCMP 1798" /LENGTH=119 /DNA_ID=CAMNT_0020595295 /DNA_START=36 /DNA_END=395 /DNA_ORIENTATION=+